MARGLDHGPHRHRALKFLYEGALFDYSAGRNMTPAADRGKIDVATEAPASLSPYNHSLDGNAYCNGWNLLVDLPAPATPSNLDEVRKVAMELGLPDFVIWRHPFPGPGLAIRCPGEITREKLEILRKADAVYIDQIRKHGLYDEIWQAFVAILPVRTVGVMGDGRTYDYACALRAVTSVDGMTADYYPFTHEFLGETATRIINEVPGINRVTYDITSKPPGTIEWE